MTTPRIFSHVYCDRSTVRLVIAWVVAFMVLVGPWLLFADDACDPKKHFCPPVKGDLQTFLVKVLNSAIFILFPVVVLFMIYTGFLFVIAQGNEAKIVDARRALFWTVVGVLILLGSKALAMLVCATAKSIDPTLAADVC